MMKVTFMIRLVSNGFMQLIFLCLNGKHLRSVICDCQYVYVFYTFCFAVVNYNGELMSISQTRSSCQVGSFLLYLLLLLLLQCLRSTEVSNSDTKVSLTSIYNIL